MSQNNIVVLVPIYRALLEPLEQFSLDYSLGKLQAGREVRFIAPRSLDTSLYEGRYPGLPIDRFDDECFASIPGYNRLLMSRAFYARYPDHAFMLILQTDAILLRDELDDWCARPYDYVGAPWPDGLDIQVNLDQFKGENAKRVHARVGNGGLSLRRSAKCIALMEEFPEALSVFCKTGSSEDIFFSIMGTLSLDFILPNERVASLFALELRPEHYQAVNGDRLPMGGHAWWRYNMPYWAALLDQAPPVLLPAQPPGKAVINAKVASA
jgi:hypothetical protein